jgi:deazaflavin-dependent oxidoreductase (nitroreductase family)
MSRDLAILQLHHVGARTSTNRVTPLAYWPISDTTIAVLASNYGAARHPAWYHNLVAHPSALVDIEGARWTVNARVASPAERSQLIDRIASSNGAVTAAVNKTSREIPVVLLELVERLR